MSSDNYKNARDIRDLGRCDSTVVKDGQRGFCDRPIVDPRTGLCDRPGDHEED